MKKVALAFLILAVLLCSCGKQEERNWTVQEQAKKGWAVSDSVSIPADANRKSIVCRQDAAFYGSNEQENMILHILPYENQSSGTAITLEYPDTENNTDCHFLMACDNGIDNNEYLTLWKVSAGSDKKEHYELVCYNQSGAISENINMDAWGMQEEIENISRIAERNDTYYFLTNRNLTIVDEQQKAESIELQSKRYDILSADDTIFLVEYADAKIVFYDISAGTVGEPFCEIPVDGTAVYMKEGKILVAAADGLYRCDIENLCMELLLEWNGVGLKSDSVRNIVSASEDMVMLSGYEENTYTIWKLTTTDEMDERTVITLMTRNESDRWLTNCVYEFNEQNEEYRVVLDNPTAGLAEEDVATGQQLLLTSSNPPDLVDLCYVENWEEYAGNGMFEDLSSYFEKSDVLEKTDYLPNILEGGKIGEQQIFIPYSFGFTMLYGQEQYLGKEAGWTLQEMLDQCDWQEEISILNNEPALALRCLLLINMEEFVDYSQASCDFEVPLFYDLLQCTAKARYTEGDYTMFCSTVLEERALIDVAVVFNMESYLAYTGLAKENTSDSGTRLVLKGYPSESGEMRGEAYFPSSTYFGICSGSDNKEGAWQFVEYCLSCQDDFPDAFPTRRDWLIERMQAVESRNFAGVELRETTEEDEEQLLSIIEGLRFTSNRDETVLQIVIEEAQEYYEGRKSEEEAARMIQDRVQLYLWEKSD